MAASGLAIPSQSRPIRFGHDPLAGVGHTDSIRVEEGQLVAAGLVSRDTSAAREVVTSSKNGFPWQASVGASVDEFEFIRDGQKVTVNGRQHSGPLNVVRRSTLGEISFVDLGADGATSAAIAASAETSEVDDDAGSTRRRWCLRLFEGERSRDGDHVRHQPVLGRDRAAGDQR